MARSKRRSRVSLRPVVYALITLVLGIALIVISQAIRPSGDVSAEDSATASAPASAPSSNSDGEEAPPDDKRDRTATDDLSGMLLLFGAACLLTCVICIGWLVVEIRKARPAWKKQKKFPKMR